VRTLDVHITEALAASAAIDSDAADRHSGLPIANQSLAARSFYDPI
jgi:hypothetical protein